MVFNLSERPYDNSLFGNRVLESGFPDHFAPPVALCVRRAAPRAARARRVARPRATRAPALLPAAPRAGAG